MGSYNQPTVIPYQPSFLERIAPQLVYSAAQFGMQKLGQDWKEGEAEIQRAHEKSQKEAEKAEEKKQKEAERIYKERAEAIKGVIGGTLAPAKEGPYNVQPPLAPPPEQVQKGPSITLGNKDYEVVPWNERIKIEQITGPDGKKVNVLVGNGKATVVPEKAGFTLGKTRYDHKGNPIVTEKDKSLDRIEAEAGATAKGKAKFAQSPAALKNLETVVMPDKTVKTFRRGDKNLDAAIQQGATSRVVGKTEHDVIETKEFQALREQEIATRDIFDLTSELESAAKADPTIIGFVGSSQRLIDRAASQMVAASKVIARQKPTMNGKPVSESTLLDPKHYNLEGFDKAATRSAAFKSTIVRLAYVMARAQEPGGGRFSDRDIQLSLDQIAGNQGSTSQLVGALNAVRRNSQASFNNRYRVVHGKDAPADMFGSVVTGQPLTAEDYLKSKGL